MKPSSTFKLSKETKRVLATITDPHKAGHYKRLAIQAQLQAEHAAYAPLKVDKQTKE